MAHQNAPAASLTAGADTQRVRVVRGRAYFERCPFDRDEREQLDLRQDWWRSTLKVLSKRSARVRDACEYSTSD